MLTEGSSNSNIYLDVFCCRDFQVRCGYWFFGYLKKFKRTFLRIIFAQTLF